MLPGDDQEATCTENEIIYCYYHIIPLDIYYDSRMPTHADHGDEDFQKPCSCPKCNVGEFMTPTKNEMPYIEYHQNLVLISWTLPHLMR